MFTDEIYKDILIDKNGKMTTAHVEAYKQKCEALEHDPTVETFLTGLKQVENGYQLFRKKYPEYPEDSFRRYCFIRLSLGGTSTSDVEGLFAYLGWATKPEYFSVGR